MRDSIEHNGPVPEVSVEELDRYLTGISSRFENKSSTAILQIFLSRLKPQFSSAQMLLDEMLRTIEETQPDISHNEVYIELRNLREMLFPAESAAGDGGSLMPSAREKVREALPETLPPSAVQRMETKETVKPQEFIGGAINPYARIASPDEKSRREAVTIRPGEPLPESGNVSVDNYDGRATLPAIDQKEMARMLEQIRMDNKKDKEKDKRMKVIFGLDADEQDQAGKKSL